MRKRIVVGTILAGVLLFGAVSNGSRQTSKLDDTTNKVANPTGSAPIKITTTCNGTTITSDCSVDGVSYKTYIYHPAVAEKSHNETTITYHEEVTGYCTLCNDGTYSPSCATGRGACSYHQGVAQWNAPVSRNIPATNTTTIIDAPAQDAYYEKVTE